MASTKIVDWWVWVERATSLLTFAGAIAGMFLAVALSVHWWRLSRSKNSWWLWGVYFWPSECTKNLVKPLEPLLITIRCQIINSSFFPMVITDVLLKLTKNGIVHEFEPYAFMGPEGFIKTEEGWQNDKKELFHPFAVEPRKAASRHLLLISVGRSSTRLRELTAGQYEGKLIYKQALGRRIVYPFQIEIDQSEVGSLGDTDNPCPVGKLARDIIVKK